MLRKLTEGSLKGSFKTDQKNDIRPMVKMKVISKKKGKKKVVEFYGEIVEYNGEHRLLIPSAEVASIGGKPSTEEPQNWREKEASCVTVKDVDIFMGRIPIVLEKPLLYYTGSAVIVCVKERGVRDEQEG